MISNSAAASALCRISSTQFITKSSNRYSWQLSHCSTGKPFKITMLVSLTLKGKSVIKGLNFEPHRVHFMRCYPSFPSCTWERIYQPSSAWQPFSFPSTTWERVDRWHRRPACACVGCVLPTPGGQCPPYLSKVPATSPNSPPKSSPASLPGGPRPPSLSGSG